MDKKRLFTFINLIILFVLLLIYYIVAEHVISINPLTIYYKDYGYIIFKAHYLFDLYYSIPCIFFFALTYCVFRNRYVKGITVLGVIHLIFMFFSYFANINDKPDKFIRICIIVESIILILNVRKIKYKENIFKTLIST